MWNCLPGTIAVRTVIDAAHNYSVRVIASNHDFYATPSKEEIIVRLIKMQELGADILKIAVMPQNSRDVITLLSATEEMARLYAERPLITMSMGGVGLISRLCGGTFGSAVTFGAVGKDIRAGADRGGRTGAGTGTATREPVDVSDADEFR